MRCYPLRCLLLIGGVVLSCPLAAQDTGVSTASGRFFTTTGVSLVFPVGTLRQVAGNGRGTTFNLEYRINDRLSVAGAWDAGVLPVQTDKLVANLDPALTSAIRQLKGTYQTNAVGVYGIWYDKRRLVRPYLTGGVGLNVITVPRLAYNPSSQLLSLESTTSLAGFVSGGVGLNWQFSQPVAAFGEASAYLVPGGSTVAAGSNHYLTLKMGLRFPLF